MSFPVQSRAQARYDDNLRRFNLLKSPFFELLQSTFVPRKNKMTPKKLKLAPFVTRSEPNTPIYATTSIPEEAPDAWFAPIVFKEKIAIMTIESIPSILAERAKDHTVTQPTDQFSPRLLPLLDRMKIHFSRMMAMARHEAENGVFDWNEGADQEANKKDPILPVDVMSSLQVEALLAGIQEIRDPEKDNRVVFRRYWRLLAPPGGKDNTFGAVIGATSTNEVHLKQSMKTELKKHWNATPKVLVAEFDVGADGLSLAGRMLQDNKLF